MVVGFLCVNDVFKWCWRRHAQFEPEVSPDEHNPIGDIDNEEKVPADSQTELPVPRHVCAD